MNACISFGLCVLSLSVINGQLYPYQPGPFVPQQQQLQQQQQQQQNIVTEPPSAPFSISCYSNGQAAGSCPAPGRIMEARVVRQRSGNCRVYTTFGFVGNYLWVRNGCGGDFEIRFATNELNPNYIYQRQQANTYPNNNNNNYPYNQVPSNAYPYNVPTANSNCPSYDARFSCASVNQGYNICQVPYEIVRVDVKQLYSSAPCQFATSYGRTENGKVWVTNGCSAKFDVTFKVCQGEGDSNCKVSNTMVDCQSNRSYSDVTECTVPFQVSSVQLSNRNTALNCNNPQSYGQTVNGVWVNNGCYGTFNVQCQIC